MSGNYLTVYCRREFEIANPTASGLLLVRIDYDDGFVAYLNGLEVARSSSLEGAGVIGPNTTSGTHEAGVPEEFALDPGVLVAGTNVLAVEVHNGALGRSDLSFIPELVYTGFLMGPGESWRFLRGSAGTPEDWQSSEFNDDTWESGTTGLGYGDGDDITVLDDMQDNYAFVLFRKASGTGRSRELSTGGDPRRRRRCVRQRRGNRACEHAAGSHK
jgi:hypothetical protein